MSSHNHRHVLNVILHDGCERCAKHVKNGGLSLDATNWPAMWQRMLNVDGPSYAPREEDGQRYESRAEGQLGSRLYEMAVGLERYTALGYAAWWICHPAFIMAMPMSMAHYPDCDFDGFGATMRAIAADFAEGVR